MYKWYAILLIAALAVGASALETTVTCEKVGAEVAMAVNWPASPELGYRLLGKSSLLSGDWEDLTDRVAVMGEYSTNLSSASYFFRIEEFSHPVPDAPDGMVLILPGSISGTNPLGEGEVYSASYPETFSLTVDRFFMDAKEVTGAQWSNVVGWAVNNGYEFPNSFAEAHGADYPIHAIRWIEAALYCNARSEMEGRTPCYQDQDGGTVLRSYSYYPQTGAISCDFTANGFRLPTNDEWEYAARGGASNTRFWWGDTISHANANYTGGKYSPGIAYDAEAGPHPSYKRFDAYFGTDVAGTAPVSDFAPNNYGLYNMLGNVAEFTTPLNPVPEIGLAGEPLIRGGAWSTYATKLRCGDESGTGSWTTKGYNGNANTGIRTVLPVSN